MKLEKTYIDILDDMLVYLSDKDKPIYSWEIFNDLKEKYTYREISLSIEKLHIDNYVNIIIDDSPGNKKSNPPFYCKLNYHGFLFLDDGGYKSEKRRIRQRIISTKAKIIANIVNAIAIIAIGIFSIYVQYDSKKKDSEIEKYKTVIESLNKKLYETTKTIESPNR